MAKGTDLTLKSDRERLEDELQALDLEISKSTMWTQRISWCVIRRDQIKKDLKSLGKKDWFSA